MPHMLLALFRYFDLQAWEYFCILTMIPDLVSCATLQAETKYGFKTNTRTVLLKNGPPTAFASSFCIRLSLLD